MSTNGVLQEFESYKALLNAYVTELETLGMSPQAARIVAVRDCKYVPHVYRGGYVIPHFGYSTERIGRYVSRDKAGTPENVR